MVLAQETPPIPDLPVDIAEPFTLTAGMGLIVALAVTALALGAGAIVYYVLKNRRSAPAKGALRLTPRAEARQKLARLEQASGSMDAAQFTVELTAIVKGFLSRRFSVDLESYTTDEYWASLDNVLERLPPEVIEPLAHFLQECDKFKFQGTNVSPDALAPLFQQAAMLVEFEPVAVAT